jgi:hypothetical protein
VIWSWYAVRCRGDRVESIEPLRQVLEALALGKKPRPNTARPVDMQRLKNLRKPVVDKVREQVLQEREALDREMTPKLQSQLDELDRLRGAQVRQLELTLSHSQQDQHFKDSKKNQRMKTIDKVFSEYEHWVEDTMKTAPYPYIQIMGVIARTKD